jgi:hypothetical protein
MENLTVGAKRHHVRSWMDVDSAVNIATVNILSKNRRTQPNGLLHQRNTQQNKMPLFHQTRLPIPSGLAIASAYLMMMTCPSY